jgi:hypothetical protein
MEAATTLPFSRVRTFNGELLVDGLRVGDEAAVELVRELEERGETPDRLVTQMIEVGARVIDRERSGAQADVVRAEFDRLKSDFADRLNKVFGADEGHVARILEKHFGDDSSAAVQHRVRAVMTELATQMREDMRRQFTSDAETNPIVAIQRASLQVVRDTANQQAASLEAMRAQMEAMRLEVAALKAEKEKLEEVAQEAERGTAKGRTYEEGVYEALDAIAAAQGDDCDAVGDLPGLGGRKGDVVVGIDACHGPARGRIVFEAKNSRLPKKQALAELDEARAARGAEYAVLVVPSEDKLPARTRQLREFNGDKVFVVFDPDEGSRLSLEVAYSLARARILMTRGEVAGLDAEAIRAEVERAIGAMEDVRRVKQQLTHAANGVEGARGALEAMATGVRGHLAAIEGLLDAASADDDDD